jgi:two-component system, OmpR family, sensor histidine kinase KdpD
MEPEARQDPDALLAAVQKQTAQQQRGRLKVFLGMAAGVGKTYAMLEAARRQQSLGQEVVVAFVETHGRAETSALLAGLTVLPRRPVVHQETTVTEMDLDAVLARHPQLALVDELAHTNEPGGRHPKRYQDVNELLAAGIDVYTTLNVQHVASRADTVREVTGVTVREMVPDSVLDEAEIELVDLSPSDLLKRLAEGKVYVPERAAVAASNFFREGNLTALRELALRLAAELVGQDMRDYMQGRQIAGPWKTDHRLLVAVSASPYSEPMVRWTRRLADSLNCTWVAAYVETARVLSNEEQARLTSHLNLARDLGAEFRTTSDEDLVRGLLRLARAQNVTQIIVGKPARLPLFFLWRSSILLSRLVRESGNIDIHIVRAEGAGTAPAWNLFKRWRWPAAGELPQYLMVGLALIAVTLVGLGLAPWVGPRSVALLYLLAMVGLALRVSRGPVFLLAALSALAWNFIFLPPRFTFYIQHFEDALMFGMYFVVALVMGQLLTRLQSRQRLDRQREERATAIYLLNLDLSEVRSWGDLEQAVSLHLERTLKVPAKLLRPDGQNRLQGDLPEKELSTAQWAYSHGLPAGRFTDTLALAEAMYVPLAAGKRNLGVLRLAWPLASPPTFEQRTLLEAFVRHIALEVDRQRLRDTETAAKVLAESERLGRLLLNSVSHELRTPLAALVAAASGLESIATAPTEKAFAEEIQAAASRLNSTVGNILDMTRLESGRVQPHFDWHSMADVVQAALQRCAPAIVGHRVKVAVPPDLPPARVDGTLLEQALANLLLNAAMHTPADSLIEVAAAVVGDHFTLTVADNGPGLPTEALGRVFDKFYRLPGAAAGGLGLGLSIVRGFILAQGGQIEAANRPAGGAIFTIQMPLQTVPLP